MTNTEAKKVLGDMLMKFDFTDAELQAIIKAGEALDEERWISVEDRLPEYDELVTIFNGYVIWMAWLHNDPSDPHPRWMTSSCGYLEDGAKWWLPRPKPPHWED